MTVYMYYTLFAHITLVCVCVCVWHTCFIVYKYQPINGIELIDLIDLTFTNSRTQFSRTSHPILMKTYTCYRRGWVELIYQFSSKSNFLVNM